MEFIEQLTGECISYEHTVIPLICLVILRMNPSNIISLFREGKEIFGTSSNSGSYYRKLEDKFRKILITNYMIFMSHAYLNLYHNTTKYINYTNNNFKILFSIILVSSISFLLLFLFLLPNGFSITDILASSQKHLTHAIL
jgi:hypothetical protein